jgi:hypothetical protein
MSICSCSKRKANSRIVGDFGPLVGAVAAVFAAGVGSPALVGDSRRARIAMASLRASSTP